MPNMKEMQFIDLFAGIGGFRIGFERAGFRCAFSAEWNPYAGRTYAANFGEEPAGDIRDLIAADLPSYDLLLAGFPCQPFSLAGVSKKQSLGRAHGFLDETQGTLFFDLARILKETRPRAFVLENVKNLISHDQGKTFATILRVLAELGYHTRHQVLSASPYVPQKRERIFIVGFRSKDEAGRFIFPVPGPRTLPAVARILENKVDPKYTLSDHLWQYLQAYKEKHSRSGNGFGFGLVDPRGQARTLSARYYKDGSEILIPQKGQNPRRLTPRECARLMGFPDSFRIVVSDTQAYKQFGNSVAVPVVEAIARELQNVFAASATSLRPQARPRAAARIRKRASA